MKKTAKILSVILALMLIVCTVPNMALTSLAASGTCGDNLTWQYNTSTYTLTISGTGAMTGYSSSSYNGTMVTTAPWRSYYNTMKTLVINSGVTSIGNWAFSGCTGLTSVTIPDSVTSIGGDAFYGCIGLTSITIPDSVTSIGNYAFYDCTGLISITIPDSVKSIGNYAFSNCTALDRVNISDIVAWCNIWFYSTYSNPSFYAHNLYLNDELVTDLVIPNGVTSIRMEAFRGCTELTSVTIPDSVTSIGNGAFYDCTGLTSIIIPDSVTSIGNGAFYNTAWLDNQPDGLVCAGKVAYKYKGNCPSIVTIKEGTVGIAGGAFEGCTGLKSIAIPDSVTNIGTAAFYNCKGLTSVTTPDSVTHIGSIAFKGCTALTTVTIPDSVLTIGNDAFPQSTVIYGTPSSAAETFANSNGNKFIVLPDYIKVFYVEKTDYYIGSTMDPDSVIIAVYFADGEVKLYYKNFTVSGFDTSTPGEKTVTVSYCGKKATFIINVSGVTADDLTTLVDMMLGKGKADEKYDLNGDGNVNILDLIKMKKQIANI